MWWRSYRLEDAWGQLFAGTGTDDSRRRRVNATVPLATHWRSPRGLSPN